MRPDRRDPIYTALVFLLLLSARSPVAAIAQEPSPTALTPSSEVAADPNAVVDAAPAPSPSPSPKPADKFKPSVGGYLQTQFSVPFDTSDNNRRDDSVFFIRRARLRVKGELIEKVGYTVMVDGATPSNLLRDAFISLGFVRHHEIRVGQQKVQFGYENVESSPRLYIINRSFASDLLARALDSRDVGIGVLGSWDLDGPAGLEYGLTLVNGSGPNLVRDETSRKNFWGRVGGKLETEGGLKLWAGVSYATGDQFSRGATPDPADDFVFDFQRFGADVRAEGHWFFAAAEWLAGEDELESSTRDASGGYILVAGKTKIGLGPIFRWETLDSDSDLLDNSLARITLGAYYDLKPVNVRLMVNYEVDASNLERDDALLFLGQVVF